MLALKLKLLRSGIVGFTHMTLGIHQSGRNVANQIRDGGGLFDLFSQTGAMVLLISPEQIMLQSCTCTQIEALEERNRWLCLDDTGDLSAREKNVIDAYELVV